MMLLCFYDCWLVNGCLFRDFICSLLLFYLLFYGWFGFNTSIWWFCWFVCCALLFGLVGYCVDYVLGADVVFDFAVFVYVVYYLCLIFFDCLCLLLLLLVEILICCLLGCVCFLCLEWCYCFIECVTYVCCDFLCLGWFTVFWNLLCVFDVEMFLSYLFARWFECWLFGYFSLRVRWLIVLGVIY